MISTGIVIAISLLVKSAPGWLPVINDMFISPARDAVVGKLVEKGFDKGIEGGRKLLRLDEKEQARHLELSLKNAAERGLVKFQSLIEQRQYSDVLTTLSEAGPQNDLLRREALRLFTLDTPNLTKLNAFYNDALRVRLQGQALIEIDAVPYLSSFFDALIAELYIDPLFHDKVSDVLKVRATMSMQQSLAEQLQTTMGMQRSLTEVVATLRQIYGELEHGYTTEQFEKDVQAYTAHIERTLHYLKLVGVVPKERGNESRDPELDGIFVPLRVALKEQSTSGKEASDSIIDALEQYSCLVLLGSPGSGKSTATRHLAWSHAVVNLSNSTSLTNTPLLTGKPLPLRIELRRLNEDRNQRSNYDFLTYVCEVLLRRAGLDISPQMFKTLLERRAMLILFDGLDEVATPIDRSLLVGEIESFAQRYPGNRFLVTSRPVGYELAPLNEQIFALGEIQSFNDSQIHLFLENWYTYVLQLPLPLPLDDQQELETLYNDLKTNPRLHSLAENPLLLTVITALHRYERLPDRRVLVYDKCADLLLDTWAKLRGTDVRWKDLRLSKDDQMACVAHLGFVLHSSAQEQQQDAAYTEETSTDSLATDVPAEFILQNIKDFLREQNLYPSKVEQNSQARRFLELIQEEAGLIVERGKDKHGDDLYGFVHRTFQEFFAAVDVYIRYQQAEDPAIISEFLNQHLHDPQWYEVILLLFGKLRSKPVTKQLRQILDGKIQSRWSQYTDILQQDLFFVCSCLADEIIVEHDLAEQIVSRLSDLIKDSPFPTQRKQALDALNSLVKTPQYASLARETIQALTAQNMLADISVRIEVIRTLYLNSTVKSEEQKRLVEALVKLAQEDSPPFEQSMLAIQTLYEISSGDEQRLQAVHILEDLLERPDFTLEQIEEASITFTRWSPNNSQKRHLIFQKLIEPAQQPDISFEEAISVVRTLYQISSGDQQSFEALQILITIAQRPDLSFEQVVIIVECFDEIVEWSRRPDLVDKAVQLVLSLPKRQDFSFDVGWLNYRFGRLRLGNEILSMLAAESDISLEQAVLLASMVREREWEFYQREMPHPLIRILLRFAQQSDLSIKDTILIAQVLRRLSSSISTEWQQQANQMLMKLLQQSQLAFEEIVQTAEALYHDNMPDSNERTQGIQKLLELAHQPALSFEQTLLIFKALVAHVYYSPTNQLEIEKSQQAIQMLFNLLEQRDLSFEQIAQVLENLYDIIHWNNYSKPDDDKRILQILEQIVQDQKLTNNQRIQLAAIPFNTGWQANYSDMVQAVQIILGIVEGEEAKQYLAKYWRGLDTADRSDLPYLAELARQELLPTNARENMFHLLSKMVPQFGGIDEAKD